MAVTAPGRTRNYDPNNFEDPQFRKDKEGKFDPTTYQTARGMKAFMKEHGMPFLSGEQVWEAVNKGTVTHNGKTIELNDKQKTMFGKLSGGLFERLDAGTNNTHDNWVGVKDIDDAVKQSWKLHGTETSKEGYWTDPMSKSRMKGADATKIATDWMKGQGFQSLDLKEIDAILNSQKYAKDNAPKNIDDPRLLEALYLLRNNFNVIDSSKNNALEMSEINGWKV